jgi:hypothetical protein
MNDVGLHEPSNHSNDEGEIVRLAILERRVDDLDESHSKWYRSPSILISFIALVASIMSFAYSWYRDIRKDRDERITELQSSIVQLHSLTNQWVESYLKYKDNPDYPGLNIAFRAEIGLIGTKAYGLLNSLGDEGSALDSATVASALQQTSDYGTAAKALLEALPHAKNPGEYVVVSRMLGQFGFYRNDVKEGDKYFELAEHTFEKFPDSGVNQTELDYDNAETEAYWGIAAASQKLCDLAKNHINKVRQYMASAPNPQVAQNGLAPFVTQASAVCPGL